MQLRKAEFDFDDESDESTKLDKDNEEEDDETFEAEVDNDEEEAELTVKDDGVEFSHFGDEEEFINNKNDSKEFVNTPMEKSKSEEPAPAPKPKIANIPAHLRTNWDSYYVEILMIVGILMIIGIIAYFLNFSTGKTKIKNQKIANVWFNSHCTLLGQV